MSRLPFSPPGPAAAAPLTPPPGPHPLHWAGECLWLLPERALWWPAQQTLCVADLHLGKAATFRALGQPVPSGTTAANLARLAALLARYPVQRLVFLGDFLHAPQARTPALLAALQAWRARHARLEMLLVRGNHDQRAGDPPPALGLQVVNEPWPLEASGRWRACHHPQLQAGEFRLAGHLHPAVALQGRGRDRLRLPCFVHHLLPPPAPMCLPAGPEGEAGGQGREAAQAACGGGLLVLPAFGEFTGHAPVVPAPGQRCFAVAQAGVWPLPAG